MKQMCPACKGRRTDGNGRTCQACQGSGEIESKSRPATLPRVIPMPSKGSHSWPFFLAYPLAMVITSKSCGANVESCATRSLKHAARCNVSPTKSTFKGWWSSSVSWKCLKLSVAIARTVREFLVRPLPVLFRRSEMLITRHHAAAFRSYVFLLLGNKYWRVSPSAVFGCCQWMKKAARASWRLFSGCSVRPLNHWELV